MSWSALTDCTQLPAASSSAASSSSSTFWVGFAVFSVPDYLGLQQRMVSYAQPGRTAAVYPVWGTDQLRVVLLFRTPSELDYDRYDRADEVRLIRQTTPGSAGTAAAARRARERRRFLP